MQCAGGEAAVAFLPLKKEMKRKRNEMNEEGRNSSLNSSSSGSSSVLNFKCQ